MTTAKLVQAPAEGHGVTDTITDALYQALVGGKPTRPIIGLVLLEPIGTSQRKTAQGLHRSVTFEAVKLEPVHDSGQAGELMWLLQALYEQRTSTGEQRALPLGIPGIEVEEKRQESMERIEAWSTEQEMTGGDLDTAWREHFGIGPDQDFSYGDHGVPGDYRKAGLQQLLEFRFAHVEEPHADGEIDGVDEDEPQAAGPDS